MKRQKIFCFIMVLSIMLMTFALSSCGNSENSGTSVTEENTNINTSDDQDSNSTYTGGCYKYPVTPEDPEWKTFTNHVQMINACQVPEDILTQMSTLDVIDSTVHNPLIADIFAYAPTSEGIGFVRKDLNVLNEMLEREDLKENLDVYAADLAKYIPDFEERGIECLVFEDLYNYCFDLKGDECRQFGMVYSPEAEEKINEFYQAKLNDFETEDMIACFYCDDQLISLNFKDDTFVYDYLVSQENFKGSFKLKDDILTLTPEDNDPEYVISFDVVYGDCLCVREGESGETVKKRIFEEANKGKTFPESFEDIAFFIDAEKTYEANYGEIERVPAN